jgi:hypothetical protein
MRNIISLPLGTKISTDRMSADMILTPSLLDAALIGQMCGHTFVALKNKGVTAAVDDAHYVNRAELFRHGHWRRLYDHDHLHDRGGHASTTTVLVTFRCRRLKALIN